LCHFEQKIDGTKHWVHNHVQMETLEDVYMAKIKVAGLRSVAKRVWVAHKELLHECRAQQAAGFGQGTPSYEATLDKLEHHSRKHGLLLGHVNAIASEYATEHP